jgi:hypothetical protein
VGGVGGSGRAVVGRVWIAARERRRRWPREPGGRGAAATRPALVRVLVVRGRPAQRGARRNGTGRLVGGVGRSGRAVVGRVWTAARERRRRWPREPGGRDAAATRPVLVRVRRSRGRPAQRRKAGTAQGGWWGAWVARGVPWSAGSGLPLGNGGGGGRASPGAVTPLRRDRCWCEFGGLVVDLRSGARRERHRAAGGGRGSLGACRGRPGLDCRSGTAAAVAAPHQEPWRRCDETGGLASSDGLLVGLRSGARLTANGERHQGGWWARGLPSRSAVVRVGLALERRRTGGRAAPGAVTPLRRDRRSCEFGRAPGRPAQRRTAERHRAAGGGRGSLGACRGRPVLDCRSNGLALEVARIHAAQAMHRRRSPVPCV